MPDSEFEGTRSSLKMIFVGEDGLRAGWCLLLYLALVGLLYVMLGGLFLPQRAGMERTAGYIAATEGVGCAALLGAALLMTGLEGRSFAEYGLGGRRMLSQLAVGAASGLLMLSLLVMALYLVHALAFDGLMLRGRAAATRGVAWLAAFLLVGLQEEFLTRGYLQFTAGRGVRSVILLVAPKYRHAETVAFWSVALSLSVFAFMGLHLMNRGETPVGIVAVGLAGLTFAFSLWRLGSLWWAIGFHMAWDWAQSFLFGVPDSGTTVANHLLASHPVGNALLSGGSTGPEGSVLVLPTLLLVCMGIHVGFSRGERVGLLYTRTNA